MDEPISHPPSLIESFFSNNPTIKFVRYQWIDYAGIRVRVLTASHCRRLALHGAPLAMSPVAMTSTTVNQFMPDLVPTGVDLIHPDLSSLFDPAITRRVMQV